VAGLEPSATSCSCVPPADGEPRRRSVPRVRPQAAAAGPAAGAAVIVRWGLAELPGLLRELGVARPLLILQPALERDLAAGRDPCGAALRRRLRPRSAGGHRGRHRGCPGDRRRRPAAVRRGQRDRHGEGGLRATGLPVVSIRHLLRRRVDDRLRQPRPGAPDQGRRRRRAHRRRPLRAAADARPSSGGERRHRAQTRSTTAPRRSTSPAAPTRATPTRWPAPA